MKPANSDARPRRSGSPPGCREDPLERGGALLETLPGDPEPVERVDEPERVVDPPAGDEDVDRRQDVVGAGLDTVEWSLRVRTRGGRASLFREGQQALGGAIDPWANDSRASGGSCRDRGHATPTLRVFPNPETGATGLA